MRIRSQYRIPHRTEYQEQRAVLQWAEIAALQQPDLVYLVHIPNEGKRSEMQGRRLKQIGLRPGFPDLFLFVPRGPFHGLAMEIKSDTGRVSEAQDLWIDRLQDKGYRAVVCRGAEATIDAILRYLRLEDHNDRRGISSPVASVLPASSD